MLDQILQQDISLNGEYYVSKNAYVVRYPADQVLILGLNSDDMVVTLAWKDPGQNHAATAPTANSFSICFGDTHGPNFCFEPRVISFKDSKGRMISRVQEVREIQPFPSGDPHTFWMNVNNGSKASRLVVHVGKDRSFWKRHTSIIKNVQLLLSQTNKILEVDSPGSPAFEHPMTDLAYFNLVLFYLTLVENETGKPMLNPQCGIGEWIHIYEQINHSRNRKSLLEPVPTLHCQI